MNHDDKYDEIIWELRREKEILEREMLLIKTALSEIVKAHEQGKEISSIIEEAKTLL